MLTLYRAAYVFPVSDAPLRDGAVAVADGRIIAVGPFAALAARYPSARRRDLGASALVPAAVNTHTHLILSRMAGAVPEGLPFAEWIVTLTRARAARDLSRDAEAVAAGVALARAAGTAAVGDIVTNPDSIEPLVTSDLRGVVYFELISGDPAAAEEVFARGRTQIAAWRARYPGANVRFGLSPHAPYTVSAPLLQRAARWCADEGVPLCVHAAESPAETRWMRDHGGPIADTLYGGLGLPTDLEPAAACSPIAYLDRLGVLDAQPLLAHGVQVDRDDLARLARAGVTVAHCPRSNARLACGRLPYARYRELGVRLTLGTDSLASSPSLSVWDEAAAAYALHAAAGEPPTPADLLRLATLDGAEALGLADEIGSIAPGKCAELACVALRPLSGAERATPDAVLEALFRGKVTAQALRSA